MRSTCSSGFTRISEKSWCALRGFYDECGSEYNVRVIRRLNLNGAKRLQLCGTRDIWHLQFGLNRPNLG